MHHAFSAYRKGDGMDCGTGYGQRHRTGRPSASSGTATISRITKTVPGMGTGLGLSIVKAVLEGHQAPFGVNSELGKGSIFWFGLRIAQEEKQKSGEKEAAEGKKQNGRKHTAKN